MGRDAEDRLADLMLLASRETLAPRAAAARKRIRGWGRYVARYVRRGRAQQRARRGRR